MSRRTRIILWVSGFWLVSGAIANPTAAANFVGGGAGLTYSQAQATAKAIGPVATAIVQALQQ